jgi:hypothetical protein
MVNQQPQSQFRLLILGPSFNTLHKMEFTYNNRRHADQQKTPLELMFRDSLIAVPQSFEHTKFPNIEDKIKMLIRNREEALAAHELA